MRGRRDCVARRAARDAAAARRAATTTPGARSASAAASGSEQWEPLPEPGRARSRRRPRRVPRPLRRVGAPAPVRHRVRLRHLPARRHAHRRGEPRQRAARPVPVVLHRLLDRRAATRAAATRPKRSRSCCATGSRSSACTAWRRRSCPATRRAGGSPRSSACATRAPPRRFLQIRGVWEDHVRYAITREEWDERRAEFEAKFFS